ncbi:hypothetical protein [Streptomyces sp. NPDC048057]|uniref:hypothetical protein n=1 Tax=Streptomyces sp. NPDC048057 TaxID=3155628 RepID=UPI0033E0A171
MIRGTFTEEGPAIAWYEETIRNYAPQFDSHHARSDESIGVYLAGARDSLANRRDAVGGWWINGGSSFCSVQLVACPNFFRPEHGCPQPPQ